MDTLPGPCPCSAQDFRTGKTKLLVTTDVMGSGPSIAQPFALHGGLVAFDSKGPGLEPGHCWAFPAI